MSLQIPPKFRHYWMQPGVVKAFINEKPMQTPDACENCGGMGIMWTFIAYEGPYKSASTDATKASHFHDGAWWIGESFSEKCPTCKGRG